MFKLVRAHTCSRTTARSHMGCVRAMRRGVGSWNVIAIRQVVRRERGVRVEPLVGRSSTRPCLAALPFPLALLL